MKPKAVIFDFDGIILDSAPVALKILADIAKEENLKLEIKNRIYWGLSGLKTLEKFLPGASLKAKLRAYQKWRAKELKRLIPLFPNVLEVISAVKEKGMITGLLTNRSVRSIRFHGKKQDIDYKNLFDFVQTKEKRIRWFFRESLRKKIHPNYLKSFIYKPNPGCFDPALKFLGKSGIRKEEVIYVADTVIDSTACKRAGIEFIAIIGHGPLERIDFEKREVEHILDSIEELPGFLEKIK